MDRAAVFAGILALAVASVAVASDDWPEGVVVTTHGRSHGGSLDDRATYACARRMLTMMFPGAKRLRIFTQSGDQVFSDVDDNVLPGYRMSVVLRAADLSSGKILGTVECEVTPNAKVTSLRPVMQDLAPGAAVVATE